MKILHHKVNINFMRQKNVFRSFLFCLTNIIIAGLLLSACCKKEKLQWNKTFYYSSTINDGVYPDKYFATEISESNGVRKIVEYRYDNNSNRIEDTLVEYYKMMDGELFRLRNKNDMIGELYLSVKRNAGVVYNHSDSIINSVLRRKHIYSGSQKIKAPCESDSVLAYVFIKEVGQGECVRSRVYYDSKFVLLREDYISGPHYKFSKKMVCNIPEDFLSLLNGD